MTKVRENKMAIFLFMLPATILFVGIIVIPIIMSFKYSLTKWDGINEATFIGFKNYITLFTSKSVAFPRTLKNALILALLSVFIQLPISFFFAFILSQGVKGERFFMALFFTPVLISTVVIGQLWMKIYNPDYGILNAALRALGLDSWCRVWLGDQNTALYAVFVPILWQYVGYHMLLMYAGMKNISADITDAALIDGATGFNLARYVMLPLLKPVLEVCVIFAVTGSLKAFDLIYVLTGGGPAHASEVPSTLMVSQIFARSKYGFGSAIAVMIIFLCFFFSILIKKAFRINQEELD